VLRASCMVFEMLVLVCKVSVPHTCLWMLLSPSLVNANLSIHMLLSSSLYVTVKKSVTVKLSVCYCQAVCVLLSSSLYVTVKQSVCYCQAVCVLLSSSLYVTVKQSVCYCQAVCMLLSSSLYGQTFRLIAVNFVFCAVHFIVSPSRTNKCTR
jgi:hypothetical protein